MGAMTAKQRADLARVKTFRRICEGSVLNFCDRGDVFVRCSSQAYFRLARRCRRSAIKMVSVLRRRFGILTHFGRAAERSLFEFLAPLRCDLRMRDKVSAS